MMGFRGGSPLADAISFSLGPRRCPLCGSQVVLRSRRRGLIEVLILPLFFIRPYRCRQCRARHLGFILRPRVVEIPEEGNFDN